MALNDTRTAASLRSSPVGAPASLNTIDWIALLLMIVGGINWGLVGAFGFDLVAAIFGPMSTASRIVYTLVGLAALYGIVLALRLGRSSSARVA